MDFQLMKGLSKLALVLCLACFTVQAGLASEVRSIDNDYETAMGILDSYIMNDCQDPAVYELRGDLFEAMGDTQAALQNYKKASILEQKMQLFFSEKPRNVALAPAQNNIAP